MRHAFTALNTHFAISQSKRVNVYKTLDLSEEQLQIINNIDRKRYTEIRPEIIKLSELVKKLEDLANSEDCTIKKIKSIKKDFKPIQNELYNINHKYETELKKALTKEQNLTYKKVKKQMRHNLKRRNNLRYKN